MMTRLICLSQVEAIETCGGQVTADGSRKRSGGGVLWNIIKARQPASYREIMKKTREFEVCSCLLSYHNVL